MTSTSIGPTPDETQIATLYKELESLHAVLAAAPLDKPDQLDALCWAISRLEDAIMATPATNARDALRKIGLANSWGVATMADDRLDWDAVWDEAKALAAA